MATKGERQALLFLAAVALLGAGTRAYHSRHAALPTEDLDRQIGAVEAVAHDPTVRRASARKRGRGSRPDTVRDSARAAPTSGESTPYSGTPARIDLDYATAAEIERLPGIGPSIAKRIVADREAKGAFGCLAALDAVRGIGPALLARLDSLVAFSGALRPACGQR